jgi:dihydrofolate synthase/folylpolyglutamate synthase
MSEGRFDAMERAAAIREHLFSHTTPGIKYDLDRMVAASAALGNPHRCYPCFHVAGTNGKGSVCTYLEAGARACGHKTGLFMSPHLVRFEERFLINGRPLAEEAWLPVYDDLRGIIDDLRLTFFEATTLMACELFRRENVGWAVFETGMGGRLDATNIVTPRVAVITRLAMDHAEYLGDSLPAVASEKLGIVKEGVPCIMAGPLDPAVELLAYAVCRGKRAELRVIDGACASECAVDAGGAYFTFGSMRYRINLAGGYQVTNALVALAALQEAGFGDHAAIAGGLEAARLPGRFQSAAVRGKRVIFDVGHNPDAAATFCGALKERLLRESPQLPSISIVIGIMKDKEYTAMLPHYASLARRLILARPATGRAADTAELRRAVPAGFTGECLEFRNIADAVDAAIEGPGAIVVIAGSFFTVGEAMRRLGIEPC